MTPSPPPAVPSLVIPPSPPPPFARCCVAKEAFPTTLPKDSRPDDAGCFLALLSPALKVREMD